MTLSCPLLKAWDVYYPNQRGGYVWVMRTYYKKEVSRDEVRRDLIENENMNPIAIVKEAH